jgi:hypothetical protein
MPYFKTISLSSTLSRAEKSQLCLLAANGFAWVGFFHINSMPPALVALHVFDIPSSALREDLRHISDLILGIARSTSLNRTFEKDKPNDVGVDYVSVLRGLCFLFRAQSRSARYTNATLSLACRANVRAW